MPESVETISRFGAALRAAGIRVGPADLIDFTEAAALLPEAELYWAGRATLVSRPSELPIYDQAFGTFFGGLGQEPEPAAAPAKSMPEWTGAQAPATDDPHASTERDEGCRETAGEAAASAEILRYRDFANCTTEELELLARLIAEIAVRVPQRQTRRWQPANHGAPDLRRTVRDSIRSSGLAERAFTRRRRLRPRRLILLIDVSGSMQSYARTLLIFGQACARSRIEVEVFCFGTRLTRISRQLAMNSPEQALQAAAEEVLDWAGGTRIGTSLKHFLDRYGHQGIARGAVVLICSDGLERDDPALLRSQMQRLARLAHSVVWLNPLKGSPSYQPLARGMQAALDSIDILLSGHNFASLAAVAELLPGLRPAGRR